MIKKQTITGYKWGSTEFNNALERYYTEPPEDFDDPVAEAELQAEQDEEKLLMQEDF